VHPSARAQNLSEAGLLYGPFATVVPNGALFDFTSPAIKYDFGYPTRGCVRDLLAHVSHRTLWRLTY
jgi:hypothetical protein